jgi:hypothetical protein
LYRNVCIEECAKQPSTFQLQEPLSRPSQQEQEEDNISKSANDANQLSSIAMGATFEIEAGLTGQCLMIVIGC